MGYLGTKPANALATTEQIGDGAVQTSDIANSAVTQAKLASGVAGNGPAFSYYANATTSFTNATATKILFQVADFDTTGGMFASSRFTPTVAGYYLINAANTTGAGTGQAFVVVNKNGTAYKRGNMPPAGSIGAIPSVSVVVYLNGSTDYVEIYGYQNSGGTINNVPANDLVYFQASMVRSA